jgi:catechol 2,3-dioxygenase-like lactoylglutathione lyase family enzyme
MAPLLQVFDMPTAVRFYRDVLGFEVVSTSEPSARGDDVTWALLRLNNVELMLNTAYEADARPPAPDPARVAVHGDTAIFFGCPNVDAVHTHLRAHGIDVDKPTLTSYGFTALSVKDPDGYELCFHWPGTQETHDQWVERYGLEPTNLKDISARA